MPGFIDGHKHVNNYDAAQMKSVLEAGYTTVLAGGGPAAANIALRDRIENATEWWGSLGLTLAFVVLADLWRRWDLRAGLSLRPPLD